MKEIRKILVKKDFNFLDVVGINFLIMSITFHSWNYVLVAIAIWVIKLMLEENI